MLFIIRKLDLLVANHITLIGSVLNNTKELLKKYKRWQENSKVVLFSTVLIRGEYNERYFEDI